MKRLFFLLLLLVFAFVLYNRERVFVRDPLGSVVRDGAKVEGSQVFINYNNDVLLQNDGPPLLITLVQANRPVGTPKDLKGVHWLACMTDGYPAGLADVEVGASVVTMSNKSVEYRDGQGRTVVVLLR